MLKNLQSLTSEMLMEQFEDLYKLALFQDNLSVALRIKELQGRSLGLFQRTEIPNLSTASAETLEKLINQLEADSDFVLTD